MPFTIRPLSSPPTHPQLAAVLAVYEQCNDFLALGPNLASMEMVLADIVHSRAEGCIFCGIYAVDSGQMLGVLDYALSGYEGDPAQAYLALLMIAAPWRSAGLGAQVVDWVEAEIRRDGRARCICAGVQVNNPRAQQFWLRRGYQIVSGAQDMGDGTVAYQLRKPLG